MMGGRVLAVVVPLFAAAVSSQELDARVSRILDTDDTSAHKPLFAKQRMLEEVYDFEDLLETGGDGFSVGSYSYSFGSYSYSYSFSFGEAAEAEGYFTIVFYNTHPVADLTLMRVEAKDAGLEVTPTSGATVRAMDARSFSGMFGHSLYAKFIFRSSIDPDNSEITVLVSASHQASYQIASSMTYLDFSGTVAFKYNSTIAASVPDADTGESYTDAQIIVTAYTNDAYSYSYSYSYDVLSMMPFTDEDDAEVIEGEFF